MRRAYGYLRVSTPGQADAGVSLDVQRARISAWCDAHGYELVDVFCDPGLSGRRADNRPGLQDALRTVERAAREKDTAGVALVTYSISRLARSVRDMLAISDQLQRVGADLVSLSESIDTSSASGLMVFRLLSVLAQFESDLTAERTAAALAHKRARGEATGGDAPYGFTIADGMLIEDEQEQEVIRLVGQLRESGLSYRAIGRELQRRGFTPRTGDAWHANTIRRLAARAAA